MKTEPVLSAAAIVGAIGAVLAALVGLGVINLTPDQQSLILGAAAAVLPILGAIWARNQVTPVREPKAENVHGELVALVPADGSQLKQA